MIRYECDKCGQSMGPNDSARYIVKLEIYAAAGNIEMSDDALANPADELANVLDALKSADPDDVEDQTYRCLRFDLCDECRKKLLAEPLG